MINDFLTNFLNKRIQRTHRCQEAIKIYIFVFTSNKSLNAVKLLQIMCSNFCCSSSTIENVNKCIAYSSFNINITKAILLFTEFMLFTANLFFTVNIFQAKILCFLTYFSGFACSNAKTRGKKKMQPNFAFEYFSPTRKDSIKPGKFVIHSSFHNTSTPNFFLLQTIHH